MSEFLSGCCCQKRRPYQPGLLTGLLHFVINVASVETHSTGPGDDDTTVPDLCVEVRLVGTLLASKREQIEQAMDNSCRLMFLCADMHVPPHGPLFRTLINQIVRPIFISAGKRINPSWNASNVRFKLDGNFARSDQCCMGATLACPFHLASLGMLWLIGNSLFVHYPHLTLRDFEEFRVQVGNGMYDFDMISGTLSRAVPGSTPHPAVLSQRPPPPPSVTMSNTCPRENTPRQLHSVDGGHTGVHGTWRSPPPPPTRGVGGSSHLKTPPVPAGYPLDGSWNSDGFAHSRAQRHNAFTPSVYLDASPYNNALFGNGQLRSFSPYAGPCPPPATPNAGNHPVY